MPRPRCCALRTPARERGAVAGLVTGPAMLAIVYFTPTPALSHPFLISSSARALVPVCAHTITGSDRHKKTCALGSGLLMVLFLGVQGFWVREVDLRQCEFKVCRLTNDREAVETAPNP